MFLPLFSSNVFVSEHIRSTHRPVTLHGHTAGYRWGWSLLLRPCRSDSSMTCYSSHRVLFIVLTRSLQHKYSRTSCFILWFKDTIFFSEVDWLSHRTVTLHGHTARYRWGWSLLDWASTQQKQTFSLSYILTNDDIIISLLSSEMENSHEQVWILILPLSFGVHVIFPRETRFSDSPLTVTIHKLMIDNRETGKLSQDQVVILLSDWGLVSKVQRMIYLCDQRLSTLDAAV